MSTSCYFLIYLLRVTLILRKIGPGLRLRALHESSYMWMSSWVPCRTEEEGSRRTAGGEREEKQVERTGWRRRRLPGGLAWLYAGRNRRNKASLRHSPFFPSTHFQPLPLPLPFLCHICSRSVPFFPLQHPFFSLSTLFLFLPFIVLYLCSAHSFHSRLCVFECPLTPPSLHGKNEPGGRSGPACLRLC